MERGGGGGVVEVKRCVAGAPDCTSGVILGDNEICWRWDWPAGMGKDLRTQRVLDEALQAWTSRGRGDMLFLGTSQRYVGAPADSCRFVWGSMIMAVIGYVNQQPLRAPKDASSPLLTLGCVRPSSGPSFAPHHHRRRHHQHHLPRHTHPLKLKSSLTLSAAWPSPVSSRPTCPS